MIRCNSFCVAQNGDGAAKAARRIDRYRREVVEEKGLGPGGEWSALALAIEGDGLPMVHGFEGYEYSRAELRAGKIEATRDPLGTRPLYVDKAGRWVASDHRYFVGEGFQLLPPGTTVEMPGARVTSGRLSVGGFEGTLDEAAGRLATLIRDAVRDRVSGRRRVAVSFSGGLDSSILARCASSFAKVLACSVSTRESPDARTAEETANELDLEYSHASFEKGGLREAERKLDLPFVPGAMDRGLWCIYSEASRLAAVGGAEMIMLGQLADELFGGYSKYERELASVGPQAAAGMMLNDVRGCGMRGFVRDELACSRWIEPSFPFADRMVAAFGLSLPIEMKISGGVRKAVLRRAALKLGLPEEIALRRKKAAQYSSGVLKVLS